MSTIFEPPLYRDVQKLDDRLSKYDLRRISVPVDGNFFFHAVIRQFALKFPKKDTTAGALRAAAIKYLRNNDVIGSTNGEAWEIFLKDETPDAYLSRMGRNGECVDKIMIQATASFLKLPITIITTDETSENGVLTIHPKESEAATRRITLGYIPDFHYFSTELLEGSKDQEITGADIRSLNDAAKHRLGQTPVTTQPKSVLKQPGRISVLKGPRHVKMEEPAQVHRDSPGASTEETIPKSLYFGIDHSGENGRVPFEDIDEEMDEEPEVIHERRIDDELDNLIEPSKKQKDDDIPLWDRFVVIPPEDRAKAEGVFLHYLTKFAKYLSVLVFAGVVFLAALVVKATLLVIVNAYSNDYPDRNLCPTYDDKPYYIRYMTMLMLMTTLCFPDFLTLSYCLYRMLMKHEKSGDWSIYLWGAIPEIINAVGLTFLVVKVLPEIDATLATLLLSLVAFLPAAINVHAKYTSISRNKNKLPSREARNRRIRDFFVGIACLILQPGGYALLCWQMLDHGVKMDTMVYAVVSLFFISFRYWENFVTCDFVFTKNFKIKIHNLQQKLDVTRFKTAFFYSIIRMGVMVGCCFLIHFVINGNEIYIDDRGRTPMKFIDQKSISFACTSRVIWPLWNAVLTNCFCGLGAFFFGRIACQTVVQLPAYTFPIALVSPVMAALTAVYTMYGKETSTLTAFFFSYDIPNHEEANTWLEYVGWKTMYNTSSNDTHQAIMALIVVVGLIVGWGSLILLTYYIWTPGKERLARTESLFVKPIYGGLTITEDLMLNRRQFQSGYDKRKKDDAAAEAQKAATKQSTNTRDSMKNRRQSRRLTVTNNRKFTPQVFLCATMWHETEQEMTQLLTSIMRLDKDQGERRPNSRTDQDFYNFQVHVLFDDAMEMTAEGAKPNKFVNELINIIPIAANKVEHPNGDNIPAPVIYPTPYGGRLEFVLPYGNLFHVHLKDKSKIRHRKRWSQCMYMYYILGYLQETKKAFKKEDVFLLALDGDVDFQPKSLLLLLDRMKRNPDVGAACGRIHPEGSGPVVWFQKFEYAVGHWLQKTAEHVLGCVLCSPGCFSLFRGEALMDVNVVNMYTTKASEALHYIQWDQGEDRWLCTLLLKQGWRIEYSAASDSFTFAPEDFKEFFNQRRRWGPSTMANIFDILMNASLTVRNNEYISWGYIAYQMGLMASSILGPATVVLVVAGGFEYVFGFTLLTSLLFALIPTIIFIILCYTTKPDFQLAVAGILTIVYALVMMAVLVGIIGQMTQSLLNPNSIFMFAMVGMYAFTGIIHPSEMLCLLHGLLYYLCVPSAFILLMVYSLCNMNNVSWGTREVKKPVLDQEAQNQALKQLAEKNKKKGKKSYQLGPTVYDAPQTAADGYYSCGLGNLCQCALCINAAPAPAPPPQPYQRVPTEDPSTSAARRKSTMRNSKMYRPVTGVDKTEMIRKYSVAKSKFMGEQDRDPKKLMESLNRKVSLLELREIMQNDRDVEDVRGLRKSLQVRRNTMRKLTKSYRESQKLTREQLEEQARQLNMDFDDDDIDDEDLEDDVDEERLQDEEEEGLYWILDGPMTAGVIEYLDDQEHTFWKEMIRKYLLPLEENKEQQNRIKSDLIDLRNKMTGAYFLINSLWIVLTVSLTLAIDDINITYYDGKGTEIVLQPLAFLFLIFFLVILIIQFTTMLVHRWSTFMHLLAITPTFWNAPKKQKKEKDEPKTNGPKNPQTRNKRKGNRKNQKHVEMDIENGVIEDTSHQNPAFEENNFSYRPSQRQYGEGNNDVENVHAVSDGSDLDEARYDDIPGNIPGGSLRFRDVHHKSLADVQASHPEPTYDIMGEDRKSQDSLDINGFVNANKKNIGAENEFDDILMTEVNINKGDSSTIL